MAHTIRNKSKLLNRVRRIRGQIEAVERALEDEKECTDVLHQIAALHGAIKGLSIEVIEDHIRNHIADPARESDRELAKGTQELIDIIRSYLK